ncbi:outer membrane protein assembly factor BamE [Phytohalomonas tamaricis]|uniref:outer membrane protein assembly factor BamE n=1 Tax=Phytohalomonas tamaricis TaxID=2081032 RepID=UPI000D0B0988|nr:outer membrane protein assembly factor BamE [Phytohalomonas tamaricis]
MQNTIKVITFCCVFTLLSGCSLFSVYKRDLPQGNLIKPEMVQQLQLGMTREQVQYVMGSPLLEDPFNTNQWDYVYRMKTAEDDIVEKRVTLTFDDSRLAEIHSSDNLAAEPKTSNHDAPASAAARAPSATISPTP